MFLDLLAKDRQSGVQGQEQLKFRNVYERLMRRIFAMESIRVVASTLSTSTQEDLRLAFKPDVVICDESGQCLEGDHIIALTKNAETVRAVILLGDPDQLPPTVTSEGQQNEGAQYLKRSLMARLRDCGYPSTLLNVNYRNHTQILALYNRLIYQDRLIADSITSQSERVGDTWDEFTRKRHHFRGQGFAGVRRLFISVIGDAKKEEHGTSFENQSQAMVIRHLFAELYSFRTTVGQSIRAEDVMIISPYKAQR
jgi:superfamily I DNA and/or RNA helicase